MAAGSRPRAVEGRGRGDAAVAGARLTPSRARRPRARTIGRRAAGPRGSSAKSGTSRMGWPRKAFGRSRTARRSAAARRRSHGLRGPPSAVTRLTRISSTAKPLASSAWTASRASSTASVSGRTIHRKRQRPGSRRRRGQPASLGVDLGHEVVRRVAPVPAREPRQEEVVLGEHLTQHRRDPAQRLGHGQETERVSGGRGVDDDGVVAAGFREARQLQEAAQLVHAGEGQAEEAVDVGVVEIGASLPMRRRGRPAGAEPAGQGLIGVELQGIERRAARAGCGSLARPPVEPSTSPSECAGSVDTTSVRRPAPAASAQGGRSGGLADPALAADELEAGRPALGADRLTGRETSGSRPSTEASSPSTVASTPVTRKVPGGSGRPCWRSRISRIRARSSRSVIRELLLGDLAELETHLGGQELLAPHGVVVHLGLDGGGDLAQHELDAPDQKRVEDDHSESLARSSFSRMLTKLYGGQGPV